MQLIVPEKILDFCLPCAIFENVYFESKIISAQFDRLTVLPDKVIIVDFKTNREPAASPQDIPDNYKKQLQVYKHLAEKIYPDKNVETYILWTNTAKLMPIV